MRHNFEGAETAFYRVSLMSEDNSERKSEGKLRDKTRGKVRETEEKRRDSCLYLSLADVIRKTCLPWRCWCREGGGEGKKGRRGKGGVRYLLPIQEQRESSTRRASVWRMGVKIREEEDEEDAEEPRAT
jgi:hypothetical protein